MRDSEQAIYDQIERELGRPVAATLTIEDAATAVLTRYRIIRFRGSVMIKVQKPYERFVPMSKETFDRISYPLVGGMPRSRMNDTFAYLRGVAKDIADSDRYILFGADTNHQTVWDMERLEIRTDIFPDDCMWRSPYSVNEFAIGQDDKPVPLILSIADGDMQRYSDIMQSLAPLLMTRKPDGVIWWTGDGTDGKLSIINALYKIFPDQLSSLTVKQLNGGRSNTPLLNGVLGNVVEDTGGQITNTEIYKSIGAHQDFRVHRYHSQNGIEVRGNVHHIFSAIGAPTFYTRGLSVDWRTHTVPFGRFDEDQALTLSNGFTGQLVAEMCRYAVKLREQGYCYKWSGVTPTPKLIPA